VNINAGGFGLSCAAGGEGRETSSSHPLLPLLHRPSFSLELYNRFSQNAINIILSDDKIAAQITDIDADIDAGILMGIYDRLSEILRKL